MIGDGVAQVIVAVNKMDLCGYAQERFDAVASECKHHLRDLGIVPIAIVPVAARHGENLARRSERMAWYRGPSILELLATFHAGASLRDAPFRMRIQDVFRDGTARRAVGRIESGSVAAGDRIVVSPTGSRATVKQIERWPALGPQRAVAGESIGLTSSCGPQRAWWTMPIPWYSLQEARSARTACCPTTWPITARRPREREHWWADRLT